MERKEVLVRKPVAARGLMNGPDWERSELGTKNRRFEGFPHQYFLQRNEVKKLLYLEVKVFDL